MPSAYTNLGIEKQATGENANSWGTITNTNFDIIDDALSGINTISSSATSQTISAPSDGTATQATRYATYIFSGSPSGAVTVTLPSTVKKVINIVNNYTQNITFQVGSAATTATVFPSSSGIIHTDGANAVYSVSEGSASELRHSGTTKAQANATGVAITGTLTASVGVDVTGDLDVDNLKLDGNTISSTDTNGNIILSPAGTGTIVSDSHIIPNTDSTDNLGTTSVRFANMYADNIDTASLVASSTGSGTSTVRLGSTDDWTIEIRSDDRLVFLHNGTPVIEFSTAGKITSVDDVIAEGTIS